MKRLVCFSCHKITVWERGKAILNQLWSVTLGLPGHLCGRGVTLSRVGPPEMKDVWKCTECGRSFVA